MRFPKRKQQTRHGKIWKNIVNYSIDNQIEFQLGQNYIQPSCKISDGLHQQTAEKRPGKFANNTKRSHFAEPAEFRGET